MSTVTYKVLPLSLSEKAAFLDASAEELRVLLCLIEKGGVSDHRELATMAGVSVSRVRSSIVLWESEGVILRREGNIVDEFPQSDSEPVEKRSLNVAKSIRDNNLKLLLDEIARLLCKDSLSAIEIKNIEEAYSSLGVSSEYILTLAAHLGKRMDSQGKKLTTTVIRNKARELVEKECDTLEELEKYIDFCNRDSDTERALREIFGCYSRNFSKTEKEHFRRWTDEYGYGTEIISEAYDLTVMNTQRASVQYMEKILSAWHAAGCKTVPECKAHSAEDKKAKSSDSGKNQRRKKSESPTPKYGNFDANEAFLAALDRSFDDKK